MTTGMDPENISDARKSAVINNELLRLKVDIAALQETRLAGQGSIREKDYTFFWFGKSVEERREHGVGFAVKNTLLQSVEVGSDGNKRIATLRLHTKKGTATLISVYAHTLYSDEQIKDTFYEKLSLLVKKLPKNDQLVILGDFNARVGSDHDSWAPCLGHFGFGKMNSNGQRLLEFCHKQNLCVTNSFFKTKLQHKVSWRHPRSKNWHQIDLILVRRHRINDVLLTRSYQSADCNSDHSLICCKMHISKKFMHKSNVLARKIRLNIGAMHDKENVKKFSTLMTSVSSQSNTSASESWSRIQKSIYQNALESFGKNKLANKDWFEENTNVLLPLINIKRQAHVDYQHDPSSTSLKRLREARNNFRKTARKCATEFWLKASARIQAAADRGDTKSVYEGIRKAVGPTKRYTSHLLSETGEILHSKSEQLGRWVQHFSLLYSTRNIVTDDALDSMGSLPTMDDLDCEPTTEELSKAIDLMAPWKAPGSDGIPADLLRHCKSSLLPHLHDILVKCWREGMVPQDMRDAKIITLYKNKGSRSDCNNYRGISLLAIAGKAFARVVLPRLQKLAERVYPESQCGFRSKRSTTDMIFSVRQLQEKCNEQNMPLYIAFIDLTKAFDLVSREGLFAILLKIGCPPNLLKIVKSFHTNTRATIQYDGSVSDSFEIKSGVKQGCVLAPTLFGIFFSMLLKHAFGSSTIGIKLHTRSDGNLFNPASLRAKRNRKVVTIRDLLFADDAALVAHSAQDLQTLLNQFSSACSDFGLTVSLKKTKVLSQGTDSLPSIKINESDIENVKNFIYLGSNVASNASLDKEINSRIGKASGTFARLTARVWDNQKLSIRTKANVYRSCVCSTLLYGSETWTLSSVQEKKINTFHLRCLRRILGITWQQKITNEEVLRRTGLTTMYFTLSQRRLRWLGHILRMNAERIPKFLLYGELVVGKRNRGRPKLRFKDVCKRDLKSLNIGTDDWELLANDRAKWRSTIHKRLKE
ncbi:MAG: hypothetical protein GY777_17355, partial [Candidatus Brocadiaceae bacterium]|nr:hypothetical protein [Candidatus Brocadiaceae bacterium]